MNEREQITGQVEGDGARKMLGRRGLIAGMAAVAAAVVAKQAVQPVAASFSIVGGTTNSASGQTDITGALADQAILSLANTKTGGQGFPDGLRVSSAAGYGILATSSALAGIYALGPVGLQGTSLAGDGIQGFGTGTYAHGVYGSGAGPASIGVRGESTTFAGVSGGGPTFGVFGSSDGNGGTGVYAYANKPNGTGIFGESAGTYGIYGVSDKAGGVGVSGNCTGGYGVLGTVTDGYGVLGQANTGNGVFGFSQKKHGIVGQTTGAYYGGVFGVTTTANAVGIYGSTVDPNSGQNVGSAFAGYFDGNFAVVHGTKSAAVPHHDGSYRLMYCVESPENWFEDFGDAKLAGGKADVTIDADFATLVHADAYHVFLTPRGDCKGLYVSAQTATGFSVREMQGGASSLGFSYRLVAKRKDIKADRLAKINLPTGLGKEVHKVQPASLPQPLESPKQPELRTVTPPAVRKP